MCQKPAPFRAALSSVFGAALLFTLAPSAQAQPVATQDDGFRIRIGIQSLPLPNSNPSGTRSFEQRTTASISYRVGITDLGLGLPTPRFAPDVTMANPVPWVLAHFQHAPYWLALRVLFEPPVFNDSAWRLRTHVGTNFHIADLFELFNMLGPNIALGDPQAAFITWESALVVRLHPLLAVGPEATLRFDSAQFEDVALGGRIRWEIRRAERTWAVVLVSTTSSIERFSSQEMNMMSWIQFFWQP